MTTSLLTFEQIRTMHGWLVQADRRGGCGDACCRHIGHVFCTELHQDRMPEVTLLDRNTAILTYVIFNAYAWTIAPDQDRLSTTEQWTATAAMQRIARRIGVRRGQFAAGQWPRGILLSRAAYYDAVERVRSERRLSASELAGYGDPDETFRFCRGIPPIQLTTADRVHLGLPPRDPSP